MMKLQNVRIYLFVLGAIVILSCQRMSTSLLADSFSLQSVQGDIEEKYPAVPQIKPDKLAAGISRTDDFVLFDVREDQEYNVSHLDGAIQIDPGIWNRTFLKKYGDVVRGKTVVFYCSVGVRSSDLAARLLDELIKKGAKEVKNLEGGIFAWHNGNRPLRNEKGVTPFVHPYDDKWGKLLSRKDLIQYTPAFQ